MGSDVISIVGVIIGAIGIYYARKQSLTANNQTSALEKSTSIEQERQITESFSRATDQLCSEKMEIRLGAISTLEIIANKSDEYYWRIMENFTAYIRKNSSTQDQKVKELGKVQFDIQAILSVIKKCNKPDDFIEPCCLDLQDTYLCKANLSGALLGGANLQRANLTGANLTEAHLNGVDFYGADLTGANLYRADLTGANLKGANFKGANLKGTNLEGADFTETDFTDYTIIKEANFEGANLEGVNLTEAFLCEANLTETHLEGANLQGANLRGTNLTGAYLCEANLRGVYFDRVPDLCLKGANLERADLTYSDLKGANFEGANIKEANFEGANLEGADFTEVDFAEDTDSPLFPGLHNKHNLTIDQLSKVKSLYGATNLNPELETPLKEKHPEIFKETAEHKSYREKFLQS
ncbi:pentapeptide repeat-containing protein [Methanosarcina hadiensis]|uniref:pentapeptide repeat-containing protein n=1 Tax=Methanosarcina hadiensis TaxID=3078083 RepID=UPI003977BFA7